MASDQRPPTQGSSRRRFLRTLLHAGVSLPAIAAAGACSGKNRGALGGGSGDGGEVTELIVPVNTSPWLDAYKRVAAGYERESGVKITLREFPYAGLRSAMVNAIRAGNNSFDLFHLDEPWTGEFFANGWVAPFADVDPSFSLDPQIVGYDSLPYWDATAKTAAAGGKIMSLPIQGNMAVFMYRTDLYRELGLSVPKTFEEALANGQKARQSGTAKYGYVANAAATQGGTSITYDFMPLLYAYGGDWFDDGWKPAVNSPGAVRAMNMFRQLLGLGPPNPDTVGQADVIAAMQSGQALQVHTVAAAAHQMNDAEKSNVVGKVGFAQMPAGDAGRPAPASGVWSLTVPKGNPKPRQQAALKFITWMLSKQSQLAFTKAGGIPTRKDTYAAADLPAQARGYLKAVADSLPNIRHHVRYTFSAQMVAATEPALSSIAAGKTPVDKGLDDLADRLAGIARAAGYPR
jgi:multiple sugar transport system substrate-binding protein